MIIVQKEIKTDKSEKAKRGAENMPNHVIARVWSSAFQSARRIFLSQHWSQHSDKWSTVNFFQDGSAVISVISFLFSRNIKRADSPLDCVVRLDLATRALKIPILLIAIDDLSPAPQTRSPALPPALLHFSYLWELSRHQGVITIAYHSWSYAILYHSTDISRQALLFAWAPLKTCELEYCATKSS